MESTAAYTCSPFRVLNGKTLFSSPITPKSTTLFTRRFASPCLSCNAKPEHEVVLPNLRAFSPLDGRYRTKLQELVPYIGDDGLNKYRLLVEVQWLLKLSQIPEIPEVPNFSEEAQSYLQGLVDGFSEHDAEEIQEIEKVTNHDVKAVEYFLKNKCISHPEIAKVLEFIHFGCTSEDINNLAYGLKLKHSLDKAMFPVMDELIKAICDMAQEYASMPMLSRTHGQAATPTTLGKEMAIFAARLSGQKQDISQVKLKGKFAGAVGNYNAFIAAYPIVNWPLVAKEFVESLGLCFNPYVTQIEPHDYMTTF
ncbi:Adenylosuccinate lyase [Euphorbia peplus]|nr:Adenylosuccinate lyase [Euphorbia peplus]